MRIQMKMRALAVVASILGVILFAPSSFAVEGFKRDFMYKVCVRNNGDITTLNVVMKNIGDRAEFGAVIYKNDGSVMRTFNNFFGSQAGAEWTRGPGEFKVGSKNNKCFSFSMQGREGPNDTWIALQGTAPQRDNSNPEGVAVMSQQRLKSFTMLLRLTATTPDGDSYKPTITGNFSDRASAAAPQQNQSNATDCNAYANEAIAARQQETTLGCGFSGETWEASFEQHKNWCMANQTNGRPENDTKARSQLLDKCKAEKVKKPSFNNDFVVSTAEYVGVLACEDDDFTDCYWESNGTEDLPYVGDDKNDDTESITVGAGSSAIIYEDRDYKGRKKLLTCGTYILEGDLTKVSSIEVFDSKEGYYEGCSMFESSSDQKVEQATKLQNWD